MIFSPLKGAIKINPTMPSISSAVSFSSLPLSLSISPTINSSSSSSSSLQTLSTVKSTLAITSYYYSHLPPTPSIQPTPSLFSTLHAPKSLSEDVVTNSREPTTPVSWIRSWLGAGIHGCAPIPETTYIPSFRLWIWNIWLVEMDSPISTDYYNKLNLHNFENRSIIGLIVI